MTPGSATRCCRVRQRRDRRARPRLPACRTDDVDALTNTLPDADQARARCDRIPTVSGSALSWAGCSSERWPIEVAGPSASGLVLETEVSGRPLVAGQPHGLFVSIAHSDDAVVAAVARRPVGVDVERASRMPRRRPDRAGVLDRRAAAHRRLAARPAGSRVSRDLGAQRGVRQSARHWPRFPASRGDRRPEPAVASSASTASGWRARIDALPGYVTAVVARGRLWRVNLDVMAYRDL